METDLLKSLAGAGPTFILLGFAVYALVALLKTVVERRLAMEEKTLNALVEVAALAKAQDEQRRNLTELLLLTKMMLEKLENRGND